MDNVEWCASNTLYANIVAHFLVLLQRIDDRGSGSNAQLIAYLPNNRSSAINRAGRSSSLACATYHHRPEILGADVNGCEHAQNRNERWSGHPKEDLERSPVGCESTKTQHRTDSRALTGLRSPAVTKPLS